MSESMHSYVENPPLILNKQGNPVFHVRCNIQYTNQGFIRDINPEL